MKYVLSLVLIFFMTSLVADADPNYTYVPADNTTNGIPHMTNDESVKRNYTGSYYDEYGALHYDGSKAAAKYQQIKDNYFETHKISEFVGHNEDGSTYPIISTDCGNGYYEINRQYYNSKEYQDMWKDIEQHK